MDPLTIGSIIGGGASLIGNLLGKKSSEKAIDKQNRYNRELLEYQYDRNLEMWNLQNQYNDPSAQMQRYSRAGLNPNLIYGAQNTAGAVSVPSAQKAEAFSDYQDFGIGQSINQVMSGIQMSAYLQKNKAEIKNLDVNSRKTAIEAIRSAIQVTRDRMQNRMLSNELSYQIHNLNADLGLKHAQEYQASTAGMLNEANRVFTEGPKTKSQEKEIELTDARIRDIDNSISIAKKRLPYEISRLKAETNMTSAQTLWIRRKSNIALEEYRNCIRDGRLKDAEKVLKDLEVDYAREFSKNPYWKYPDAVTKIIGNILGGASHFIK